MPTQTDDQVGKTNPSNMTLLKEPEYNQDLKSINSGKNKQASLNMLMLKPQMAHKKNNITNGLDSSYLKRKLQ